MSQKYLINTDTGVVFKHDDYLGSLPYMQPHKPVEAEVADAKPKRTRRSSAEVAAEKAAK